MRTIFLLPGLCMLIMSASDRKSKKSAPAALKAKLEIKQLCMNYTLRLVEGEVDTSLVNSSWTDESTGKNYRNVFGLASRCSFPDSIQEGDEFFFQLDSSSRQECVVCMAYYPTPPKKLYIRVVNQ